MRGILISSISRSFGMSHDLRGLGLISSVQPREEATYKMTSSHARVYLLTTTCTKFNMFIKLRKFASLKIMYRISRYIRRTFRFPPLYNSRNNQSLRYNVHRDTSSHITLAVVEIKLVAAQWLLSVKVEHYRTRWEPCRSVQGKTPQTHIYSFRRWGKNMS
jgi:hypothetical protein